jgi:hypothetical protein
MGLSNARVEGSDSNNHSGVESGLSPGRPRTNAICGHYSLTGQDRDAPSVTRSGNACIPSVVFAAKIPAHLVFNNLKKIFGYYEA